MVLNKNFTNYFLWICAFTKIVLFPIVDAHVLLTILKIDLVLFIMVMVG